MIGAGQDGYFEIPNVNLENDPSAGAINLVVCSKDAHEEPLYLLTNIEPIDAISVSFSLD